jgi:hypothetical protein
MFDLDLAETDPESGEPVHCGEKEHAVKGRREKSTNG